MYSILKYIILACNLGIVLLLLVGNNVKSFPDPKEAKKVINATWIMVWVLVMNSALLLSGR